MAKKVKAGNEKGFDPIGWLKARVAKKADSPVQIEPKVDSSTRRIGSPTKKVKVTRKLNKGDRARNKKIAKGNRSHGHGRK
jgi:hypothetical protein